LIVFSAADTGASFHGPEVPPQYQDIENYRIPIIPVGRAACIVLDDFRDSKKPFQEVISKSHCKKSDP
jgi:hypothetical protein